MSTISLNARLYSTETHLFPFPAFFSSTLHDLEQKVKLHLGHSGKFSPFAEQTPQMTFFVSAERNSAAASSGSIVHIESDSEGSKGRRRRGLARVSRVELLLV